MQSEEKTEASTRGQAPFWSDDFDLDLPKIIPDWLDILGDTAEIELKTHSHTELGRIDHPSVWNTGYESVAYFGFDDPCKPFWFDAFEPVVSCTFAEVVRDAWVHGYAIRIGRRRRSMAAVPGNVTGGLMYHLRKWRVLPQTEVDALKRDARLWIAQCAYYMRKAKAFHGARGKETRTS